MPMKSKDGILWFALFFASKERLYCELIIERKMKSFFEEI